MHILATLVPNFKQFSQHLLNKVSIQRERAWKTDQISNFWILQRTRNKKNKACLFTAGVYDKLNANYSAFSWNHTHKQKVRARKHSGTMISLRVTYERTQALLIAHIYAWTQMNEDERSLPLLTVVVVVHSSVASHTFDSHIQRTYTHAHGSHWNKPPLLMLFFFHSFKYLLTHIRFTHTIKRNGAWIHSARKYAWTQMNWDERSLPPLLLFFLLSSNNCLTHIRTAHTEAHNWNWIHSMSIYACIWMSVAAVVVSVIFSAFHSFCGHRMGERKIMRERERESKRIVAFCFNSIDSWPAQCSTNSSHFCALVYIAFSALITYTCTYFHGHNDYNNKRVLPNYISQLPPVTAIMWSKN